jgi:hypothetical protein
MWRQSVEVTSAAARVADGDLVLQGVRAAAELASLVQVLQAAADQQPVPAPAVLVLQQSDHSALLRTTAATLSVRTTRSRPPKASQRSASSHRPREYSSALSTPERASPACSTRYALDGRARQQHSFLHTGDVGNLFEIPEVVGNVACD